MRKVFYLLGHLTDSDIEWLIANGTRQRLAAGTVLIRAGEPIPALYIILAGVLQTSLPDRPLIRLETGDIVGELAFVDDKAPSPWVTALENAIVLAIGRQTLLARLDADSAFSTRFYNSIAVFLSQRLRDATQSPDTSEESASDKDEDELDLGKLHHIQMAAGRFHRILQRLLGE